MGFRAPRGGIYDGYGIAQPFPAGGSSEEYVQDAYEVPTISDIAGKWEKARAHLRRTNGTWDSSRPGENGRSTADEYVVEGTSHGIAFLFPGVWNFEFCVTAVNGALESGKSSCVVAPRPAGS